MNNNLPSTGNPAYINPGAPLAGVGNVITVWTPGTTEEQKVEWINKNPGYVDGDE